MHVGPGEPFAVMEFLKPGIDELASVLPPRLAGAMLGLSRRFPRLGRLHWGMAVRSTSITGYLQFRLLRALKRWRPRTHRFRAEQHAIETWLAGIPAAPEISPDLAIQFPQHPRLLHPYRAPHNPCNATYLTIHTP